MCYPSCKCSCCNNRVVSTAITATADAVTVQIPDSGTFWDGEQICIVIAQPVPTTTTPLPVNIQIGTDTTIHEAVLPCGRRIYSDQLKARRIYSFRVAADSGMFVYDGPRLCRTAAQIPPALTVTPVAGA